VGPPDEDQPGRTEETGLLTWAKLGAVCLASGLLLVVAAAVAATNSTFFLIDASACIGLAVVFFIKALRANAPRPQLASGSARSNWGVNVLLIMVLLSASSPLVKTGLETAARGSVVAPPVPPIINKVTCPLTVPNVHDCKYGKCAGGRRSR
jgi:hypothetical protein